MLPMTATMMITLATSTIVWLEFGGTAVSESWFNAFERAP
jgi:hypothetical protein